jgi:hypothetical protein
MVEHRKIMAMAAPGRGCGLCVFVLLEPHRVPGSNRCPRSVY